MSKKILILISFIFLANCSAPGSAFLGPIFTGAKTGSITQASLSFTSNKIIDEIKSNEYINKVAKLENKLINKDFNLSNAFNSDTNPVILLSYKVKKINISEVVEPEPLP